MHMKINFTVVNIEGYGGIKTLSKIAKGLSEKGHQITVLVVDKQPPVFDWGKNTKIIYSRSILNSFKRKSILALNKIYGFYNAPYRFYSEKEDLIKAMPNCDINLAAHVGAVFAVFESKKGIPVQYLQHYESLIFDDSNWFMKEKFFESLSLPVHRIVNSSWLQKKLKQHNIDAPIIYPGIDQSIFYPRNNKQNSKLRIVTFAKQLKWKGFRDVLEAVKIIKSKYPKIELVAYGAKKVRIENSPIDFRFFTNLSDDQLAELYSSATVCVFGSWYESFPGPPFEAMACGAPVVTTSIGVEDYAKDNFNCLIVPPQNPEKMAEAISRLIEDKNLRERISANGPESISCFKWEETINKFEALFKKLLVN